MMIKLIELDAASPAERKRFAEFVNQNYDSPIPLEESAIESGRYRFFWAHADEAENPVGTSGYLPRTPFLAETVKTVVRRDLRGKKLGEEISNAIEEEVRRRGFRKITSTIYVDNLPMIFIKLKQGYRFEGFHPDHEKPGLHEYSFGKTLSR